MQPPPAPFPSAASGLARACRHRPARARRRIARRRSRLRASPLVLGSGSIPRVEPESCVEVITRSATARPRTEPGTGVKR